MRCLVQFYDEWLDFRIPEMNALLQMHGLRWDDVCCTDNLNLYPAAADIDDTRHFYILHLPNEEIVRTICARSILIKAVYELWDYGATLADCVQGTQGLPEAFVKPYTDSGKSWAIHVNSFGRNLTMEQKQDCRERFKFLDFKGPVNVTAAQIELWISLDYTQHRHTIHAAATASSDFSLEKLNMTDIPTYFGRLIARGGMKEELKVYDLKKRLYLGPTSLDDSLAFILANISGVKPGMLAYDPFVGTASILVALTHFGAFCTGSDIDPRVLRGEMHAGTTSDNDEPAQQSTKIESVAHAAAAGGDSAADNSNSGVKGKDTSIAAATAKKAKQARADATKRNIFENFKSYGLPKPELIRMDNHLFDRHFDSAHFRTAQSASNPTSAATVPEGYFDVIVSDPPYGIRAGAKKTGKNKPVTYSISEERRHDHIPSTQRYPVEEVMLDLLHTAARSLVNGGMLTYLLPTTYDFTEKDLPVHPCLQLVQVCHQSLSSRHGRRAIVMQKYREYTVELEKEYGLYKAVVMSGEDQGFGLLMGKLQAALDADAFNNDAVVKSFSSCSSKRKASKDRRQQQREEGIFFPPKRALVEGEGGRRLSKKQLKRVQQSIDTQAGQVSVVPVPVQQQQGTSAAEADNC